MVVLVRIMRRRILGVGSVRWEGGESRTVCGLKWGILSWMHRSWLF
jgi:hypothetical protein